MKLAENRLLWIGVLCFLFTGLAVADRNPSRKSRRSSREPRIKVVPWGPGQAAVDRAKARVANSHPVRAVLAGTNHRLLGFEYVENLDARTQVARPPVRYRVIFYDYTNDRTFVAESDFAANEAVSVQEVSFSPGVDSAELDAAYEIVRADHDFAVLADAATLELYEAMPPISNVNGERLVNVGARNRTTGENQIIGVSFKNSRILRYPDNAPPTSTAGPESCGIPNSGQGSTGRGLAGQYLLTVNDGQTWQMLITRPSSSSGSSGSGIDLQNVRFRNKSVLKRAHAPWLNVKYAGNACGPFLDWQYAEGFFDAPSAGAFYPNGSTGGIVVLAPGQIATTALETGNDTGNFQGVAIYRQGSETVLVSEMNAGWYRYIMEWRFDDNGTIRPRYGFGATDSPCVCLVHYHHVYWRFDFDVVNAGNRVFQVERGRKFLRPVSSESAIFRNVGTNRSFVVQNGNGDEAYMLVPNLTDGRWDEGDPAYGAGDFWILKTAPNNGELGTGNGSALNMSPYLNGESVDNTDLTVWYGGHFTHSDGVNLINPDHVSPDTLSGPHVLGPDIRPIRW